MEIQTTIEKDLRQIADMLLLNGTLTECPGLVHGKMGIAVFFFHYAKYTDNMLFADYAMDLIGEIQEQIHVNSPADYEKGLAGVGLGFDYLIRNDFLKVEEDICEDFDQRMVRAVMYDPWQDFSRYNGLTGYGRYWMTRLRFQIPSVLARKCLLCIITLIEERLTDISTEEQTDVYCFLRDLSAYFTNIHETSGSEKCVRLLEKCKMTWTLQSPDAIRSFARLGDSAVGHIVRAYQRSRYFNEAFHDEIVLPALDMEKAPSGMGLLNGYAGEGMMRLTAIHKADLLWMRLL